MPHRAAHRVRQFVSALRPRIDPRDRADAYRHLNDVQRALFESMTPSDQRHGIDVFRRVRIQSAAPDGALFVAALLHDCGKGNVRLWHRVAHVILTALAPGLRRRLASEQGAAYRGALWRLEHHPALGAGLVAETGAHPDTVRMIREQEAPTPDARLALLQAADDA
jgi:hypothetical protein